MSCAYPGCNQPADDERAHRPGFSVGWHQYVPRPPAKSAPVPMPAFCQRCGVNFDVHDQKVMSAQFPDHSFVAKSAPVPVTLAPEVPWTLPVEPVAPEATCAKPGCGRTRNNVFHDSLAGEEGHAFVPASSPPAPVDGFAVCKAIAGRFRDGLIYLDEVAREAYAAGLAEGRAAERRECEAQLRKQASEHEAIAEANHDIYEPQMLRANCLEAEADAIAARRAK
jgi:hypothetical protein